MMQIGLVGEPSMLLSVLAAGADWNSVPGRGVVVKLQHELTAEIESAAATMLRLEFQALPHADLRRTALASADRTSSLLLISFPICENAIAEPAGSLQFRLRGGLVFHLQFESRIRNRESVLISY